MRGVSLSIMIFLVVLIEYGVGNAIGNSYNMISIVPHEKIVKIGENFTVYLNITPIEPVQVAWCNISFNSSILKVIEVRDGGMFKDGFSVSDINNTIGLISYIVGISVLGETEEGTFAIIKFEAIRNGTSFVNIQNPIINGETNVSIINGTINVFEDTIPPSTTASLSPSSPDGNNGWYVSNVVITLNAVDSDSGVNSTYYSIDGGAEIRLTQIHSMTP